MVFVDSLSKYGGFIGLPSIITSESAAATFVIEIIGFHGIPNEIMTCCDALERRLQGTARH